MEIWQAERRIYVNTKVQTVCKISTSIFIQTSSFCSWMSFRSFLIRDSHPDLSKRAADSCGEQSTDLMFSSSSDSRLLKGCDSMLSSTEGAISLEEVELKKLTEFCVKRRCGKVEMQMYSHQESICFGHLTKYAVIPVMTGKRECNPYYPIHFSCWPHFLQCPSLH